MPHTVDVIIERSGCSLQILAEKAGVSLERMQAIVDGRWTPAPDERERIAAALNVPVDGVSWGHTMNPRNVRYRQFGLPDSLGKQS